MTDVPPTDRRDALIREQAEQIAAQAQQITALEAVVAELRERLAAERARSRNSSNSSMPPSSDDAQPGSPGAAMAWQVPDRTEDYYPQGECACGRDLVDAADLGVARSYQQEEIPVSPAQRVQHDLHEARCACGRAHVAARPPGVPESALSIGPRLRALAVYLVVFQHVPVERCRHLIADVTGAVVSAGFIHSCLSSAAGLAADAVALIRTLITAAAVAGFDETTLRSGPAGDKKYVHGAFTEQYSAFWLGSRSLESMRQAGILPRFAGIVVSDRYQNYFHESWKHIAGNQACLAHLLRDYQDCAETYPGAVWPVQAQRALRGLIRAWHAAREQGLHAIPADVTVPSDKEFRHAVLAGLASVPRVPGPKNTTKQRPGRELLEFCNGRQGAVLRFTTDISIWPTNNISERGVRPLKTQQKISGRLTSYDATQDRLDIRSYTDTARKHGRNAFTVLCDLMTGNPRRPPRRHSPRNHNRTPRHPLRHVNGLNVYEIQLAFFARTAAVGRSRCRTLIRRRRRLLNVTRMSRANDAIADGTALNDTRFVSPFTQVDDTPADIRQELADYLDRLAALPGIQRVRRVARAALDIHAGQRLLDAGCGAGEEARELARLTGPDGEVTAIDLSSDLVTAARRRDEGSGVRYAVGDIAALDFPDATFDSVRTERVLQHLADPDAAIAELIRVTVPGGRVCLVDTDWESFLVDGMPGDVFSELQRRGRELNVIKPAGRQLRGRLVRAGLTAVTAEPVPIPISDRRTAETLHPFLNPALLGRIARIPGELAGPWFSALDDALARDEFLAVLTIWVVTGVKPAVRMQAIRAG